MTEFTVLDGIKLIIAIFMIICMIFGYVEESWHAIVNAIFVVSILSLMIYGGYKKAQQYW